MVSHCHELRDCRLKKTYLLQNQKSSPAEMYSCTHQMPSGEDLRDETKIELLCLNMMMKIWVSQCKAFKIKGIVPPVKQGVWGIMLRICVGASGTGALHKRERINKA
ncbi:hypothetical protein AMECASPLE_034266 [Ameca splendens]|uniref:Uncharacterized protein n=1 Tax=Ameca splendens TaxID=208324 RepID=A0ABV0XWI7_9TELE